MKAKITKEQLRNWQNCINSYAKRIRLIWKTNESIQRRLLIRNILGRTFEVEYMYNYESPPTASPLMFESAVVSYVLTVSLLVPT